MLSVKRTFSANMASKSLIVFVLGLTFVTVVSATSYGCGRNEIFTGCVDEVCWKTCEHLRTRPHCAAISDNCDKPGCVCKKGFLRNKEGDCVSSKVCQYTMLKTSVCSRNERFVKCTDAVCVTDCKHLKSRPFCKAIADCYKPGCVCKKGFLRDARGSCVPQHTCPQAKPVPDINCPVHETFVTCTDAVCWKTCVHLFTKPACAAIADCDKPGCVCKDGFLRNKRGVCVPKKNCPRKKPRNSYVCPTNEVYAKCTDAVCWKTCSHLITRPLCAAIADCNKPGCVCKKDFLRNENGVCVPSHTCPPAESECGLNEMPVKCRQICPPQDCSISYTEYAYGNETTCEPGCDCLPDYLRNDKGICIHNEECSPQAKPVPDITCPANEQFVNCTDAICWKNCTHLYNKPACPAITDCDKPGCVCNLMGFLRNEQGVCVRTENCPLPPHMTQCPVNEVLAKCADAVCWPTCEHLRRKPPCPAIADCDKPACVCQTGYFRDERGACVSANQCYQRMTDWYRSPSESYWYRNGDFRNF